MLVCLTFVNTITYRFQCLYHLPCWNLFQFFWYDNAAWTTNWCLNFSHCPHMQVKSVTHVFTCIMKSKINDFLICTHSPLHLAASTTCTVSQSGYYSAIGGCFACSPRLFDFCLRLFLFTHYILHALFFTVAVPCLTCTHCSRLDRELCLCSWNLLCRARSVTTVPHFVSSA